jgi:two-component system, cell cycle sensor histidine kinase and response regulator CckA
MSHIAKYDLPPDSDSAPGAPGELTDHVPHVLIVEDQETVRRYIARILEQAGLAVHLAGDGADALDLIEQGTTPIELVVSDIIMPRLNGVELLKALSVTHPDIPVILMSAYAQAELAQMGVVSPCGVLPKPFLPERLLQEVHRCMRKRM